jgi:hypothetical protein
MADQWYFARNNQSRGPFSATELQALAASGQIRAADTVWKEGMEKGVLAAKVKHLFAVVQPSPTVAPAKEVFPTASSSAAPAQSPVRPVEEPPPATPFEAMTTPAEGPLDFPDDPALLPLDDVPWSVGVAAAQAALAARQRESASSEAPAAAEKPAARIDPRRPEPEVRQKRVTTVKGGTLVNQDGVRVKYRKKCIRCGHDDTCVSSAVIQLGCVRVNFYCPRCRKSQQTEIHAV